MAVGGSGPFDQLNTERAVVTGPLNDVQVLDLTTVVMGPFATQILGDMGADVIKIEAPGGDTMRRIGPFRHDDMGPLFLQANRNKRSVVLDLKQRDDLDALIEMAAHADVLVYNIRPQGMRRLGLDYESLARRNPGLIFCGAYGFGEDGPYAGKPAYDDIMQAACGISSLFTQVNGQPGFVPLNICDRTVGMYLANAVLGALFHKQRTGEGQSIEVPMFETMAHFVSGDHLAGESFVPSLGPTGYKRLLSTQRGPYATLDGHIGVVVYTDTHWSKFAVMVGCVEQLVADDRFTSMASRTIHAEAVGRFLADQFGQRSNAEWLAAFNAADIPITVVNTIDSLFTDPHLTAVQFWKEMDHPTEGCVRVPQLPGKWSRTPPSVRRLAPRLGEHTGEVLSELATSRAAH